MAGGGEGSKERRRLKRLAKPQQIIGNANPAVSKKHGGNSIPLSKKGNASKARLIAKRKIDSKHVLGKRAGEKKATGGSTTTEKQTKKKKQFKVKKPKHLKRKLEQLSNQGDEATRDKVIEELTKFEANKKKYSKHQSRTNIQFKKIKPHELSSSISADIETEKETPIDSKAGVKPSGAHKTQIEKPASETFQDNASSSSDSEVEEVGQKHVEGSSSKDSSTSINDDSRTHDKKSDDDSDDDNNRDDNSDDDSDDDDNNKKEEESATDQKRQRGRRRRGRKDTASHVQDVEQQATQERHKHLTERNKENDGSTSETKNLPGRSDQRYCIGRKPVTDFVVGQKYKGKIVYVKSFGVFVDIGCHSDAFCHVSRLRDDFVEDPLSLFKEGDAVEARVVEIDRKQKRLTVSFQSEGRLADERASLEAREQRKKNRSGKRKASGSSNQGTSENNKISEQSKSSPQPSQSAERRPSQVPISFTNSSAEMNPAELKRARKLARRAARREQGSSG